MATLIYEMLLTRIFSVTMWYHFAFVAVSIALFGMTVGANIVYLRPNWYPQERLPQVLCIQALWFAISTPLSFLTHLSIPFHIDKSLTSIYSVVLNYTIIAIPFVFSGIIVALVLTRYPRQVNRLYAVDLAGAAAGALIFIRLLEWVDGPNAVLIVALLAALSALCFGRREMDRLLRRRATAVLAGLAVFTALSIASARMNAPLLRVIWAKDTLDSRHFIDMWNAFSRVTVDAMGTAPFGWGLSPSSPADKPVDQMYLTIDGTAGTPITRFDGKDMSQFEYLRYDIVNLAHYLRSNTEVAVLGVGGGRDVLSALLFHQSGVRGLEINDNILRILGGQLRGYSGSLDRNPKVQLINDEARSWLSRTKDRFGIIQVSLIDTWAATSAGAFVLTENSLYTTEAWDIFLQRLHPDGILTFSRWYFPERPAEAYRLMALAVQSLKNRGIQDAGKHIIFARLLRHEADGPDGVGTIMISPQPFQPADEARVREVCQTMGFDVLFTPSKSEDPMFSRLTSGEDLQAISDSYPLRIDPPTDNSPFFFQMMRLKDIASVSTKQGYMTPNIRAVVVLGVLLFTVVLLTAVFIVAPLAMSSRMSDLAGAWPLLMYFSAIGLGFMFVEISQMQRLIVFLGHPTYGLGVVLFSLLLSSGLGSYASGRVLTAERHLVSAMIALIAVLAASSPLTRIAANALAGAETPVRIGAAVLLLAPMGLFMGIAFPVGMRLASQQALYLTPWLWGINGATSVCGSVLSACIALAFSISTAYWSGVACYVLALSAVLLMRGARELAESPAN